jgi:hypothetical protein
LLAAVTLTAILLGWLTRVPRPSIPNLSEPIREVRLSLFESDELRITDPELIQSFVVKPLIHARIDSRPAAYVVLGQTSVHYDDGTQDAIIMFLPWGRFKHGGEYGITDFREFQAYAKRSLPDAPRYFFDQGSP